MSDVETTEEESVETEDDREIAEQASKDSFTIKVNGETVHEVDIDPRLVVSVSLRSAQGEAGIAGSPFSGVGHNWVNLVLVTQQPTALPVVEDNLRLKAAEEGPEEVQTYNEVAARSEEEVELNDDGSAADTSGEEDAEAEPVEFQ